MEVTLLTMCLGLTVAGLLFQSLLHGSIRLMVYPLSLVLGIAAGMNLGFDAFWYLVSFDAGMAGRAAIGGYWNCVAMEIGCLIAGLLVGVYLL